MTLPHTPDPAVLYRVLAESAPDPIITIDEGSTILSVNPAAERIFGYAAAEMLGQSLHMLIPERMRGGHDAGMGRYLATGRRHIRWQGIRVAIRTKSGAEIPVEVSFGEFVADGRRLFAGFLRDVTAQIRAEARLAFLGEASRVLSASLEVGPTLQALARLVIPGLADYCHVDLVEAETGEIRRVATAHVNPAKQAALDEMSRRYPPNETPGYATVRAIHSGAARLLAEIPPAYLDEVARDEGHRRLAEALAPRSFVVAPLVARGRVIGAMLLAATPDSERRYGSDDLAMVEELARRAAVAVDNARLYQESERARAAAEAASRAKDQFVTTMSHELRTPLNAIGGYAELLEMGLRGPVTDQQRQDLTRIRASQRHLLSLVNDVLDVARLSTGVVDLRVADISLADVFADLEALVRPQVDAKALAYEPCRPDPAATVRADGARLVQVLANLVSNSTKFTPAGGRIAVACEVHEDVVEVRVTDTGIGIPADQLDRIFEPFTQVHEGLTRPVEGTGLGLAISRALARGMGGDLTAESVVGEGSVFTLTLPRAGPPAA
jgi:PAS domain S-box-containing protein